MSCKNLGACYNDPDPYFQGALYNIGPPLIQKYGEDSASAIFERWSSCFAQNQVLFFETQQ